ncbi:MAG: FAD-binding oxidoreductase [Thermoplasmata archaeon]
MNGEKIEIVDAVIYPTEEQVPNLFKNLGNEIEIVIFGGGTSVTEGLTPKKKRKYSVSLDIKNFRDFKINKESLVLEAGTGFTGPELEKKLNSENLTLGHFPESFEHSTIGGWIATNAAGQESNRYGIYTKKHEEGSSKLSESQKIERRSKQFINHANRRTFNLCWRPSNPL